jgi:ATP-dependent DNA helicase DinG
VGATTDGELYLGGHAADRIRREIERARGNEVSFMATVAEDGEIRDPKVVSRGNASAVLAAVRDPHAGGVLVHNHPSGVLEPSHADLAVAERLWEMGIGFAITDNAARELYVVLEPPAPRADHPLDLDDVERELEPGGPIAREHGAYEDRPQQRALSRLVGGVYNDGGIAIAEAGTGTGKSIAYLLPAIRWALRNRERTVVSTNTINLQEQLVEKDLPFLRRALAEPFTFALVKGRNNYVSIRRARLAWESAPTLLPDDRQKEIESIVAWLDETGDGSLSDLSFRPSPEVWDEVASESDVCLRAKCPHFEACFYQRARRDAATADVLVANHHLLFSDLAVRQAQGNYDAPAVLPRYRRLILDEAHNLEDVATRHLGATVSRRGLFRVLRRLEHRGRGVLPSLAKALQSGRWDLLAQATTDLLPERIFPSLEGARDAAGRVFTHLEAILEARSDGVLRIEPRFADHPAWRQGLDEDLSNLLVHLETLLKGIELLRERVGMDEEARAALEAQLLELRGAANRLDSAAFALRTTLKPAEGGTEMVRWMEMRRDPRGGDANVSLAAVPLDLSGALREALFERIPTIVMTSATLATRQDFTFLRERLGLGEDDPLREAIFPSPFDFERQAVLAIPTDLPVPGGDGDRRHGEATIRATMELAGVTGGGLFVLFTSYRALRDTAAGLRRSGIDRRWPLFVQGEGPRAQLVQRFVASGNAILLGTSSFWEGVDVPGRPLRGLVIPKLPFKVPSEPVTAARIEAIEARGGNSFASYMLPHAAIRLKQGFGRLIRSQMDQGVVLLLDSRIVKKSYGTYLVESLPPATPLVGPWKEVLAGMKAFYAGAEASDGRRTVTYDLPAIDYGVEAI